MDPATSERQSPYLRKGRKSGANLHGNAPLKVGLQKHLMKLAGIDESEL
jgi:hypothetical protein